MTSESVYMMPNVEYNEDILWPLDLSYTRYRGADKPFLYLPAIEDACCPSWQCPCVEGPVTSHQLDQFRGERQYSREEYTTSPSQHAQEPSVESHYHNIENQATSQLQLVQNSGVESHCQNVEHPTTPRPQLDQELSVERQYACGECATTLQPQLVHESSVESHCQHVEYPITPQPQRDEEPCVECVERSCVEFSNTSELPVDQVPSAERLDCCIESTTTSKPQLVQDSNVESHYENIEDPTSLQLTLDQEPMVESQQDYIESPSTSQPQVDQKFSVERMDLSRIQSECFTQMKLIYEELFVTEVVIIKQEACACDVCRKLFSGACDMLQFEEKRCSNVPVPMKIETMHCTDDASDASSHQTCSSDYISNSTCEVCGGNLVDDSEVYRQAKDIAVSSGDMDYPEMQQLCGICLSERVGGDVDKKDLLDDCSQRIEYECAECLIVFESRIEIQRHVGTHERIEHHVCPICEKYYEDGKEFYCHFISHENKPTFLCRICQKSFTCGKIYRFHVKSHDITDALKQQKDAQSKTSTNTDLTKSAISDVTSAKTVLNTLGDATTDRDSLDNKHVRETTADITDRHDNSEMCVSKTITHESTCFKDDQNQVELTPYQVDLAATVERKRNREDDNMDDSQYINDRVPASEATRTIEVNEEETMQVGSEINTMEEVCSTAHRQPKRNDNSVFVGNEETVRADHPNRMEKVSEEDVANIFQKKFTIDRSKKLKLRKTLVIPKAAVSTETVSGKQTNLNNNVVTNKNIKLKDKRQQRSTGNTMESSTDKNNNVLATKNRRNLVNSESLKRFGNKNHSAVNRTGGTKDGHMTLVSTFLEDAVDNVPRHKKMKSNHSNLFTRKQGGNKQNLREKQKVKSSNTKKSVENSSRIVSRINELSQREVKNRKDGGVNLSSSECSSSENRYKSLSTDRTETSSDGTEESTLSNGWKLSSESSTETPSDTEIEPSSRYEERTLSGYKGEMSSDDDFECRKRLGCKYCPKTFRHKYRLDRHVAAHEGRTSKGFRCDLCSARCKSRGDLAKHMVVHTGERPHTCDVCDKTFTQKGNLSRHMVKHTDANKKTSVALFSCDVCSKRFTQKAHMTLHQRIHTGEKPYECDICGECFTMKHHLKRHLPRHENGKIMTCPVCKEEFTRRLNYSRHLRTHSSYKDYRLYRCKMCDRGFDTKFYLHAHMMTHTGEKPFNCDVCNVSFTVRTDLNKHKQCAKHKRNLQRAKIPENSHRSGGNDETESN